MSGGGPVVKFKVCLDRPALGGDAFILYLGPPAEPPMAEAHKRLIVDVPDDAVLEVVRSMDPALFSGGLCIVVRRELYPAHKAAVDAIIAHLSFVFCKFVYYPNLSLEAPDVFGARKRPGVNLAMDLRRLENLGLYLRWPIVDKLAALRLGRPVLILNPGPSLAALGPHLKALSRKCLVVTISRCLQFCLDNGVEPDFVLQLDIHTVQPHYYPDGARFPNSVLVPLSLAALRPLAHRFRGICFMDSFDPSVLPNRFRIRESWLSSFFPCLGLAEVLAAPAVYVAGADLCYEPEGNVYVEEGGDGSGAGEAWPGDQPVLAGLDRFDVPDRDGRRVRTRLSYMAAAYEATEFAREITASVGSAFHNLSPGGLLDRDVFASETPEALAGLPDLDRTDILARVDQALEQSESVDLTRLRMSLAKRGQGVGNMIALMRLCLARDDFGPLEGNEFVEFVNYYKWFIRETSPAERVRIAVSLLEEQERMLPAGINFLRVVSTARRNGTVHLLCLEDEIEDRGALVRDHFPGLTTTPMVIWAKPGRCPEDDRAQWIDYARSFDRLRGLPLFLVSARAHAEFGYMFRQLPLDNWLRLDAPPLIRSA